ncbi:iron-sulfur cluster assembly scaffold protein [Prosthecochloris sp. N3]|uniref:Iron-sulfur cluster assembly scaffold protein n=1 Tax=Prosthecochloris ethylica TaxID=2743976 RepID=A0ABR9XNW3_9CHLB|nr:MULTISPECIES: iron-sulfur cluster assembly scaffold protein [Prosthecochloris]MEC9486491.1 iron-sulfur cluster assembly scaffold protein [Prosthecochloris sp.]MBF0585809.1 iron-sulfur cluster assembly scaffold protein [Prosthecochloris ethylica]MBF0635719.1 iron-sulfur cluster assembly scaffold protein [Prosthecochloris ethylica]NUK47017.1 iron-sulfur cluster assembly scaffold protein [Prosthecochloris ethylica]RNA65500.1 iron-sulfur cluster assembly scaffold protein [Prosthecochloris sp. Z
MLQQNDWAYTDTLKEHFMNPKNILQGDDVEEFDGVGMEGNLSCGDQMMVVIKVDRDKEVITDCQWKTYGCASAIASTSVLSEMVKGMTLDQAFDVSPKDVTKELGGLPENKIHCSVLGDKALRAAINNYFEQNGMSERVRREKTTLVCQCMNVTDAEIEEAVLEGARSFYELQEHTKIGTVCGQCKDEAEGLIEKYCHLHFGS